MTPSSHGMPMLQLRAEADILHQASCVHIDRSIIIISKQRLGLSEPHVHSICHCLPVHSIRLHSGSFLLPCAGSSHFLRALCIPSACANGLLISACLLSTICSCPTMSLALCRPCHFSFEHCSHWLLLALQGNWRLARLPGPLSPRTSSAVMLRLLSRIFHGLPQG